MNCVRKHLSAHQGRAAGRALRAGAGRHADDQRRAGRRSRRSSPAARRCPIRRTCADALAILARYGIDVPAGGARAGWKAARSRRPSPAIRASPATQVHMIATPQQSLEAAAALARARRHRGAHPQRRDRRRVARGRQGARGAGARRSRAAAQPFAQPCVILSGGETTVTRASEHAGGRGGRATEFLLGCAHRAAGRAGRAGRSPPTPTASTASRTTPAPFVTPDTLARAAAQGLKAARLPRPQRRLRLLRGARRPGRHRADATPTSTTSARC